MKNKIPNCIILEVQFYKDAGLLILDSTLGKLTNVWQTVTFMFLLCCLQSKLTQWEQHWIV